MSRKAIFRNNKLLSLGIYGIVSVCLILLALMILPRKVLADTLNSPTIQGRAPMPGSSDIVGGQQNTRPWFAVGVGAFNGKTTWAKVYVPVGQSATVTLTNGGGVCEPWGANSLDVGTPSAVYHLEDLASNEIYNGVIGPAYRRVLTNSGGCRDISFPIIPADAGIASEIIGHENYRVFFFVAHILNQDGTGLDHEKNFKISTSSGLVGVSRAVSDYVTYPLDSFSIYQRDAPQLGGQESNYAFQFAPRCDEAKTDTQTSIKIYDADHGVYAPQDLRAILQRDDRAVAGFNWSNFASWSGSELGGNHETRFLGFTANNIYRYKMHLNGFNWRNTIQIQIPYDQFDAQASVGEACEKSVNESASCDASGPSNLNVGESATITVKYTNNGNTTWEPTFQARQTSPSGGAQNLGASVPPDGTITKSFNIQARASPVTVNFWYGLFDGGNVGSSAIPAGQGRLCSHVIRWNNPNPPPGGNLIIDGCSAIQVVNLDSDATHTVIVQEFRPPTPGIPNPFPPPVWLREPDPGQPEIREERQNDFVDYELRFIGSDGSRNTYSERISNGGSRTYENTFVNFPFLYPHISYTVELWATISGSYGFDTNQRNPNPTQIGSAQTIGDPIAYPNPICMEVSKCEDYYLLAPRPRPEPGEADTLTFGMTLTNQTGRTFPSGTYAVLIEAVPAGSMTFDSGNPINHDFMSGPGPPWDVGKDTIYDGSPLNGEAPINVRVWYQGYLRAHLLFNGNNIDGSLVNGRTEVLPCAGKPGVIPPTTTFTPYTRPYLKLYDGDVSAGGAFRKDDGSCPTDDFISPEQTGDDFSGGIRTYAYPGAGNTVPNSGVSTPAGASVDFGAHALGLIDGTPYNPLAYGFYGASLSSQGGSSIVASGRYNYLFFANQDELGGKLGGSSVDYNAHCAPDFIDTTATDLNPTYQPSPGTINVDSLAAGQYFYNGPVTLTDSQINRRVSIYVKGDVYINGDINYGNWTVNSTSNTAPYFALVVKGNIHVDWNVSRLDGLYVAQPNPGTDNGILSTCSVDNDFADAEQISNQCRQKQLTFNGAAIVQHVYLLRSKGTLTESRGNCERPRGCSTDNIAEIFNYAPSMVIGQPNFKPTDGGAIVPGEIEGLFSLPPVF